MINILVCDDDKDIVDAIEIYLAPEGYRILKAYDGIQAIEMMRKNDIQLLIMDVMNAGTGRFFYLCRHQKDKRYSGDHTFCQGRGI